jgi:hypothetical protein
MIARVGMPPWSKKDDLITLVCALTLLGRQRHYRFATSLTCFATGATTLIRP